MTRKCLKMICVLTVLAILIQPINPSSAKPTLQTDSSIYLPLIGKNSIIDLPPIIPGTTKVLDEATNQYLEDVSPDGSFFTFSQTTPILQSLSPADIIVSEPTTETPYGFLREVTSVEETGGKVIVETAPASLDEAIEQGSAQTYQTLSPSQISSSTLLPGVSLNAVDTASNPNSFGYTLENVVLFDFDGDPGTTYDQVRANGAITFDTGYEFACIYIDNELKLLRFAENVVETSNLIISSEVNVDTVIQPVVTIAEHTFLPGVTIWIGPVPIVMVPKLSVYVGVDGTIHATVTSEVTQQATLSAGAEYTPERGMKPIASFTNDFIFNPPTMSGTMDIKGYLGIGVGLMFYGVVGPTIGINDYLQYVADSNATPAWVLYGGLEVPVSIIFDVFHRLGFSYDITSINFRKVLEQASIPPYPPYNPYPADGATNQAFDVDISWSGGDPDGDSVVYDVYFDTVYPPTNLVSSGQGSTFYDLAMLGPTTPYYWKIVAWDEHGASTSGPIWSFTTAAGTLPGPFGKVSPTNGATDLPTSLTLDWGDSSGATSYEYCYDTTNDNACSAWTSTPTSQVSIGGLSEGITYYWQARAVNPYGATYADGSEFNYWSFTTSSFPFPTFVQHDVSTAFGYPSSVFAIDVDGDGDIDLLTNEMFNSPRVSWLENDGNENFTEHIISSTIDRPLSVFATDVDGDGDVDVLAAARDSNQIVWWENDGYENFMEHFITSTFVFPVSVYAADIDDDMDIDVLGASYEGDRIAWWENDGNESFTEHEVISDFLSPSSVYAGDIDKDGDIDILGTAQLNWEISWFENDGNENFTKRLVTDMFYGPNSAYISDVDGDGDNDVLGAGDQIGWWENDGNQIFSEHIFSNSVYACNVIAADVDGDGDMDVISGSPSHTIAWFENDGVGNFTQHEISSSVIVYSVYAQDMDGDGDVDLMGAFGDYPNSVVAWFEQLP